MICTRPGKAPTKRSRTSLKFRRTYLGTLRLNSVMNSLSRLDCRTLRLPLTPAAGAEMPPSQPRFTLGVSVEGTRVIGGAAVRRGSGINVGDEIVAVDGRPVDGCHDTLVSLVCANDREGEGAVVTVLKSAGSSLGAHTLQDVWCTRTCRGANRAHSPAASAISATMPEIPALPRGSCQSHPGSAAPRGAPGAASGRHPHAIPPTTRAERPKAASPPRGGGRPVPRDRADKKVRAAIVTAASKHSKAFAAFCAAHVGAVLKGAASSSTAPSPRSALQFLACMWQDMTAVEYELPAPPAPAGDKHAGSLLTPAPAAPSVMASPPTPDDMKVVAIANIPTHLPLDYLKSMIAYADFDHPYDLGVGYYAAHDASTCKLYFHLDSAPTARRLLSDLNINFWSDIAANLAHPGTFCPPCSPP